MYSFFLNLIGCYAGSVSNSRISKQFEIALITLNTAQLKWSIGNISENASSSTASQTQSERKRKKGKKTKKKKRRKTEEKEVDLEGYSSSDTIPEISNVKDDIVSQMSSCKIPSLERTYATAGLDPQYVKKLEQELKKSINNCYPFL